MDKNIKMIDVLNSLRESVLFESDEVESVVRSVSCELSEEDFKQLPLDESGLPAMRATVCDAVLWLVAAKTAVAPADFDLVLVDMRERLAEGLAAKGPIHPIFVAALLRQDINDMTITPGSCFVNACLPPDVIRARVESMLAVSQELMAT